MDSSNPDDKEIAWAVRWIFWNRSGSPSGIRAEHLRQWLIAESRYNTPDTTNWLKVVTIVQTELRDGTKDENSTCQTVTLIPMGESGDFRWVVLLEVIWNTVNSLLNHRLKKSIKIHDVLHRFWAVRGAGTATHDVMLPQQLMVMREAFLFEVFLEIQKAYDAPDQDICLDILVEYGVGPRTIRHLWMY